MKEDEPTVKKDENDSDEEDMDSLKVKEEAEALEVRDVAYNLEILAKPTWNTGAQSIISLPNN